MLRGVIAVNAEQRPMRRNDTVRGGAHRGSRLPALARVLFAAAALGLASCGGAGGGGDSTAKFSVGGSVSGLAGSGLVLLDNGADHLSVSGNGGFTFATQVQNGQNYVVTVQAQPANPTQLCPAADRASPFRARRKMPFGAPHCNEHSHCHLRLLAPQELTLVLLQCHAH